MKTLKVGLGGRAYPIYIGSGLLGRLDLFQAAICGKQVLVVTNETIAVLYLDRVRSLLRASGLRVDEVILPDGEAYKTLETVDRIFDALLAGRHGRRTTLVALGGGVVGDMTGFAAACYQRGVDFIQVPTTLLAQVDSSVGGKTGVNHSRGKNMIGAFHQPKAVIVDVDTIATLPLRELRAGLAEVIKYGLICDRPFFDWLESSVDGVLARDVDTLVEVIERSCANKARVVAADEREEGVRATLNFGHTFGHAIETGFGYGVWLHGEAVAAGMVMAMDLSVRLGWLQDAERMRGEALIARVGLPTRPPEMHLHTFLSHMQVDKKNINGAIRLILLREIGSAVIADDFPARMLDETLKHYLGADGVR